MAAVLISTSDFVGRYAVAANTIQLPMLQSFIDEIESKWLAELLGVDLKALFLADIGVGGVPSTPIYTAIYNEIVLQNPNQFESYSSGMKPMLMNAVYVAYNRRVAQVSTTQGTKVNESTNSRSTGTNNAHYANMYNVAVANFKVIRDYIEQNITDYPDFDGIDKNYALAI